MIFFYTCQPCVIQAGIISKIFRMLKLVAFLVCINIVGVYANSYSQSKINVQIKGGKLTDLFNEIQQQTSYSVFYSDKLVAGKRITINAQDEDLLNVLNEVLPGNALSYHIVGNQITIKANETSRINDNVNRRKQDSLITIRGRIYDTHEPPQSLPGVSIRAKNGGHGVMSDTEGYFDISVKSGETLVFSMIGYLDFEYNVSKSLSSLNVSLKDDVSALDEVVVVGLTEQQRKHIASSVATLDVGKNIANKPITTLSQSLQGGVTGLAVTQGSGLPGGDAASLRIRGISTLGYANPLVLVDGVPMDMNHVDPVTVESVTVLKDAAAASIYGARGANGVILITTKRGVPGRVDITYDGYYGYQTPTHTSTLVDAGQYMRLYNEANINAGNAPFYSDEEIRITETGEDPINYPNTDWVDLMINKMAPISRQTLAVQGGNNVARFAVTGSYLHQDGMIPLTKNQRYNLRANTSITLNDKFLVFLDVNAILRNYKTPNRNAGSGGNRMLEDIHRVPPTILPKYPIVAGRRPMYGRYVDIVNPLAYAEVGGDRSAEDGQINVNLQPKWEVFKNFNLKGQFSFRLNSDIDRTRRDNYNFFDFYTGQLMQTWGQQRTTSMQRTTYYYLAGSAEYTYDIGDHHLYIIGGYSQEKNNSGAWDAWAIASGYAKLNYSLKDKYLLELSARADGSSRFGPGNRWGFFPSVAAGWNIHNEEFLKDSELISNLKLRASYGRLGNENIGLYQFQNLIDPTSGVENIWGNPAITWEKVDMLDIGLDIGLFNNNKLELTLDYYDKLTNDIVLKPLVSYVAGFPQTSENDRVPINAGKVKNRGFEVALNYNDKIGKDVSITFSPGLSYNNNKILSLFAGPYLTATTINEEGRSIGSWYGYRTDGILQEHDFDASGKPLLPTIEDAQPGDIKYLDLNNDGLVNDQDMGNIGNPTPNLNFFANLGLSYKNFDFEMLVSGSGRSDSRLTGMLANPLDMSSDGGVPTTYYAENRWTPENPNALFPRLTVAPAINKLSSDFWLQNAAFMRVRYLQIGYNFNLRALQSIGIRKAKIYFNAQNPFTFSSIKLTDPESRGNQWTYGIMKVNTIGMNIQF